MTEENKHINYSAADIEKYLKGELSPADMHAMEKAALDDPFLADAMEGFEVRRSAFGVRSPSLSVDNDITDLKDRLAQRIAEEKRTPVVKFSWWKIAAAVIIFIGAGWIYILVSNKNNSATQVVAKNAVNNTERNKQEAKNEASASIKTDSVKALAQASDSVAVLNSLAVSETKRSRSVKNSEPSFKIQHQYALADSTAVASRMTAPPVGMNDAGKGNLERTLPKDSYKAIEQPVETKSAENNTIGAGADKTDKKEESFLHGIAANKTPMGKSGQENTFSGTVVDQSNSPLANARVQIPGTNFITNTDNKGNFSIKSPDTAVAVSVTSLGYESQKINLQNNVAFNQVKLKPAQNSLNEVVVVGYGAKRKQSLLSKDLSVKIQDAEPAISREEYDAYLEKNKRLSDDAKNIHGSVVVSFTVRNDGLSHFKVEQSINNASLDQEAIRLIKEGPAWKLLKGKKASVTYMVKF